MAVISRTLCPPTLNTVNLPTLSADGMCWRSSANDAKLCAFTILYQWAKADLVSGYRVVNSLRRLRVMTCMPDNRAFKRVRQRAARSGNGAPLHCDRRGATLA